MANKIKLANIPVGKSMKAFGREFTVLEHTDEGTLVLSDIIERDMCFCACREVKVAPNNFRDSDIARYLNGEYLSQLKNSGENTDAILDMVIDLKCTLGQREYGFFKAKVGLLTLEQYGKYFDIIPKINDWWWLATPYGTPTRSPLANNADYVWHVRTDGNCSSRYYSYSYGVRPALILDSSLLVACDDMPDDRTTPLSEFSDDELIAEVKRRGKMKGGAK